jgi:hypothetical protein
MTNVLKRNVQSVLSIELFNEFAKMCRRYRKKPSQAITELIAAWVGRLDLSGSHKSTSPIIDRNVTKADIAIEQIRCGTAVGWKNLIEAVSDLLFQNQMSITRKLIDQAIKVSVAKNGESSQITKDLKALDELWKARIVTLDWDISSTWQTGYPTSAGVYLVVPESGDLRLSSIKDESHPDIKNSDIEMHLRIQPIPVRKYQKADRTVVDVD